MSKNIGKTILKIMLIIAIPVALFLVWISHQSEGSFNDSNRVVYDYHETNDYFCLIDRGQNSVLMRIDETSKIKTLKTIRTKELQGTRPRAINIDRKGNIVAVFEKKDTESTRITLARVDRGCNVTALSGPYDIDYDYSSVSIVDQGDYCAITAISTDRRQARAYIVQNSSFADVGDKSKSTATKSEDSVSGNQKAQSIASYIADAGRIIGYAAYDNSGFTIRTDIDLNTEGEAEEKEAQARTLSSVRLNLFQKYLAKGDAARVQLILMLILMAYMVFLFVFLPRRSRIISTLFTALFLILISMEGIILYLYSANDGTFTKVANDTYYRRQYMIERTISGALDDLAGKTYNDPFYTSETYSKLKTALFEAKDSYSESNIETYYLAAVDNETDFIIASTDGINREPAHLKFGNDYTALSEVIDSEADRHEYLKALYEGKQYTLAGYNYGLTDGRNVTVIGLFSNPGLDSYKGKIFNFILLASIFLSVITGFIAFLVIFRHYLDFKMIKNAAIRISKGETDFVSPKIIEPDRQPIWAAFTEIVRAMKDNRYSKESIYKAYFRFSPKNIENFLNKTSITDVLVGDQARVDGTLAIFSLESAEKARKRGELMKAGEFITYMKEHGGSGMIAGNDSDLSTIDMLFEGEKKDTVELGTSLLLEMQKRYSGKEMSLFLFHSSFWFGVTGSNEQALTYLVSDDLKIFEEFGRWFASLSIELVITEDVKEREKTSAKVRYIGYIELSGGRKERLYEVLDAAEANERLTKLSFAERFEDTIELFYSRNYYLARSEFSKILKQNPDDELCRWYLFECEKYLNSGVRPDEHAGALHTS